ncbi:doublecortin domain-containing protein 2C isoform X6 [Prionailurus viverrinus]|uniref:doublecortin domain-containing protein 2C isoform X6 n=1 Tax=Prionailurus viverrinus TaxID=61388 RepID=UPI001FF6E81E|nr:doublecortin domain-containing protein 2C isoform X6 [Prionailurus viverrinus]
MGTRRPHVLVDTTPAKTILVYRNGDAFFVARRLVVPRRCVPTFEALLEQLTQQVDVPFGVRRLFTPTRGHPVRELQALQAGGKYVAAGREPFKKLDYIHIVPRKPGKMSKLKEIKPVVHCDLNVPSRWQTFQRTSRLVNVFTNGRLFIPPVKIIIPKFSLTEWNSVLAMIGEKVFPLGGVQKLFTMNGHLLDNSKDLQDNHFYVAAGPETFKDFPYWKSSKVPSEVQRKYADIEKYSREKKKTPAEIVTEDEEIHDNPSDFESIKEKEDEGSYEDNGRKEDNSRMSFKKRFSLRHSTKEKEKEPYDLLEGKNTPVLLETPVKIEDRRQPPMGQQSREESSSGRSEEKPEEQELLKQPSWGQPSQEQIPDKREPSEQSSLTQSSQEQIPDTREPSYLKSHRWGRKR